MGYAVLHMEKAVGSDSGMSAHIERTIAKKNADASRTHLNREMITFPNGVTNRTEAIQHRLETAVAPMIPIVTGGRRKAKAEQAAGKKMYRKKSTDIARLCADDVMLRWETFLRSIGLPNNMVIKPFNKEAIVGSGELYSKEHSKRFKAENASLKLEQGKANPENIHFTINGTDIFDWFNQKKKEFLNSIGINQKEPKQRSQKLNASPLLLNIIHYNAYESPSLKLTYDFEG